LHPPYLRGYLAVCVEIRILLVTLKEQDVNIWKGVKWLGIGSSGEVLSSDEPTGYIKRNNLLIVSEAPKFSRKRFYR
jgi:hypothetical protein